MGSKGTRRAETGAGGEVVGRGRWDPRVARAGADLSLGAGVPRFCTAWLWLTPAALDWLASTCSRTSPF